MLVNENRTGVSEMSSVIRVVYARFLFAGILMVVLACAFTPIVALSSAGQISDKLGHFGAFSVLVISGALAFPMLKLRYLALILLSLGIGIELIQTHPLINRTAEWGDVFSDAIGIVFGCGTIIIARRVYDKAFGFSQTNIATL